MSALPTGYDPDGAELDALVDQVLGTRPRPVDCARLEEPEFTEQWVALDQWVRWLVTRYCLDHREIPPCWQEHGDLVEELSALHTAHQAAYDPSSPASGPAEWHQVLANTRGRLQLWVARTGCRPSEHRPHRHTTRRLTGRPRTSTDPPTEASASTSWCAPGDLPEVRDPVRPGRHP